MDQFLMIKKEEVISYLKVLKEKYKRMNNDYTLKAKGSKKNEEIIINKKLVSKYYYASKRVGILLDWYENGEFYAPQWSGDFLELMPPTTYDIINNSIEIDDIIFNILEQRMLTARQIHIDEQNSVKKI